MLARTRQTFITSDFHIFHCNIIKYCGRPYTVQGKHRNANRDPANAPVVNQMNEDILRMFDKLPLDCDVWNLGDVFFFVNRKEDPEQFKLMQNMVKRMKGEEGRRRLFLVLGNHDTAYSGLEGNALIEFYMNLGFDHVYDSPVVVEGKYILSHEPVFIERDSPMINLYGHTHQRPIQKDHFCFDHEKFLKQLKNAERNGEERPKREVTNPEREIDLTHYRNMCLDFNKGILEWSGDSFTVASPIWS